MRPESKELAHKLAGCIHTCNDCLNACLDEKHVDKMIECIRLDKVCTDVCSLALNSVHANGHFVAEILQLCNRVCLRCAEECAKHNEGHCQECARVCHECAKACADFPI